MSIKLKNFSKNRILLIGLILLMAFTYSTTSRVDAASLTTLSDKMSTVKVNTAANHEIIFRTPSGADLATDLIKITMPTGFTIGTVDYTDIDVLHGAANPPATELTLAATASATDWGAAFSGQVLTLTHPTDAAAGDIAANDYVMVKIGLNATGGNAQITNHTDAGSYVIQIDVGPSGSPTDTAKIAIVTVTNDKVVVTGLVDPSITFSLSANATAFGSMLVSSVDTSDTNIVLVCGTNADNGYMIYVNDTGNGTNPGLYNAAADYTIGSTTAAFANGPTVLSTGVEGYGIRAQGTAGTPTIDSPYNNAASGTVGGLEVVQTPLAHHDGNMTANDSITVYHHAAVAAFSAAGNYTDTITYVATGRF